MNFESSTILVYKLMFNEAMTNDLYVRIYTSGFIVGGRIVKHDENAVVIKSASELTMVKLEKIDALSIETEAAF